MTLRLDHPSLAALADVIGELATLKSRARLQP
jgi:hypothetical protein